MKQVIIELEKNDKVISSFSQGMGFFELDFEHLVSFGKSELYTAQIQDADMKHFRNYAGTVNGKVFADVQIQSMVCCPGSPAVGSDKTIEEHFATKHLHENGFDGNGVHVAIVDTGINARHMTRAGRTIKIDSDLSWAPDSAHGRAGEWAVGHGTMCAYDVAITAPKATFLDFALLQTRRQDGGSVMSGFLSDAVVAYAKMLEMLNSGKVRSLVVNNSWGMFHPSWDFPPGHEGNYSHNASHPFNRIVGALARAGADILFASGNCGKTCPDGRCRGKTDGGIYGANSHPEVICVGGVDNEKQHVGYSTSGPGCIEDAKPDVVSYTHFEGSGVYEYDGGTSAACPVAAGVVAAMRSVLPRDPDNENTSAKAMRDLLKKTAQDKRATAFDYDYGWGVVDAKAMSERVQNVANMKTTLEKKCHDICKDCDDNLKENTK